MFRGQRHFPDATLREVLRGFDCGVVAAGQSLLSAFLLWIPTLLSTQL